MSMFWPEASSDAARNSLNVAIHGLRQSLRAAVGDTAVVIHQDQAYFIEPALDIWIDVEAFEEQLKAAHQHLANSELVKAEVAFEAATWLYQGEFLADDPYEEWATATREQTRLRYLDALSQLGALQLNSGDYAGCIAISLKLLTCDGCREDAHRRLMRCYSRQGQIQLALRQYHSCVAALRTELDVPPARATTELFDHLRRQFNGVTEFPWVTPGPVSARCRSGMRGDADPRGSKAAPRRLPDRPHGQFLGGAVHPVDEQDAVEMVGLVLHAAGQRGAADDLHRVAAVGEAAGHGVLPPFDVVVRRGRTCSPPARPAPPRRGSSATG